MARNVVYTCDRCGLKVHETESTRWLSLTHRDDRIEIVPLRERPSGANDYCGLACLLRGITNLINFSEFGAITHGEKDRKEE